MNENARREIGLFRYALIRDAAGAGEPTHPTFIAPYGRRGLDWLICRRWLERTGPVRLLSRHPTVQTM